MKKRISSLLVAWTLAACTVGPNYVMPDASVPAHFDEATAVTNDAPLSLPLSTPVDPQQWWYQFPDPELQRLIRLALDANPDLASAVSRVRMARQQEIIAGAAELPQVNATGAAVRAHSNSNVLSDLGGGNPGGASGSGSTDITLYSIGFDATWEIDVFGKTRRAVQSARANTEAALWAMCAAQVSLAAEVANDYMTLRATQERIDLVKTQYDDEQQTLALVQARARTGFVTEYDVNQQRAVAMSTSAEVPPLEAEVRVLEHAIAVAAGLQPERLVEELERPSPLPPIPEALPVGLPSDLLLRRPDVREAERKLAAATADEGVAVADLYPRFNLIRLLSLASNNVGSLFSTNSLGEIGVAQVSWPIFQAGRIDANIRAKHEQAQQAYYAYQQAVLVALQDVEDALVRYKKEQERLQQLESAVAADRSSQDIALQQYKTGLVSYINVLTAQSQYRSAQDQMTQSRQTLAEQLISLYKALGGGWAIEPSPELQRVAAP